MKKKVFFVYLESKILIFVYFLCLFLISLFAIAHSTFELSKIHTHTHSIVYKLLDFFLTKNRSVVCILINIDALCKILNPKIYEKICKFCYREKKENLKSTMEGFIFIFILFHRSKQIIVN